MAEFPGTFRQPDLPPSTRNESKGQSHEDLYEGRCSFAESDCESLARETTFDSCGTDIRFMFSILMAKCCKVAII